MRHLVEISRSGRTTLKRSLVEGSLSFDRKQRDSAVGGHLMCKVDVITQAAQ
jgi:hypothetical protein